MRENSTAGHDLRTRKGASLSLLLALLGPSLAIVLALFGGGLVLGVLQGLGHMPSAGIDELSLKHFGNVICDQDFLISLGLTSYVSFTSTLIASAISVVMALLLVSLSERSRVFHFIFQIPLTVPHLVIAVAIVFLLAPTGLISRAAQAAGFLSSSDSFPILVNDKFAIGIIAVYVWKEIPFITLMILSVLKNSGEEFLDVGRTLKAGPWQRFRYITLPTIFPSLGTASLIVFAFTFGAFEVPFLLGQTDPLMLSVWAYKLYADIDLMSRPEGIAAGLVIALIVSFVIILSQFVTQAARRRGSVI
jgi:putative spermidine/putrescine transport system permease protein